MLPGGARPARPLAVRARSSARRVVSKPGQAPQASRRPLGAHCCSGCPPHRHPLVAGRVPPPPTGTATRPRRPHAAHWAPTAVPGALHTGTLSSLGGSHRRPQALQPGPAGLTPPTGRPLLFRVPSTPARSRRREYPSQDSPPSTGITARHNLHAHTRKTVAAQDTSTPRPATASSMKRQMS